VSRIYGRKTGTEDEWLPLKVDSDGAIATSGGGGTSDLDVRNVFLGNVVTSTLGTAWSTVSSYACNAVSLLNISTTTLAMQQDGAGNTAPILPGQSAIITGLSNANQIAIQRLDLGTVAVTASAIASIKP